MKRVSKLKIIALTAVNLEPKYLDCVPHYIDFWNELSSQLNEINYQPKVILIGGELPPELVDYSPWIEVKKPNPGMSTVFTAQCIRLLQPALENCDFVITSDVDMLPLSSRVFEKALSKIRLGTDFVICRDVLPAGQYPICYNFASPAIWSELSSVLSQKEVDRQLESIYGKYIDQSGYKGDHGGSGWYADQLFLYDAVEMFIRRGGRVEKMSDADTGHKRLDRRLHPFPINWFFLGFTAKGHFTDYHVHHPVNKYRKFLSALGKISRKK